MQSQSFAEKVIIWVKWVPGPIQNPCRPWLGLHLGQLGTLVQRPCWDFSRLPLRPHGPDLY
jgi:hypothetical protein